MAAADTRLAHEISFASVESRSEPSQLHHLVDPQLTG
jgi:hypothetical protein